VKEPRGAPLAGTSEADRELERDISPCPVISRATCIGIMTWILPFGPLAGRIEFGPAILVAMDQRSDEVSIARPEPSGLR
jgi:hypothetical protein